MTKLAEEAAHLVDSLPPEKAQALVEYARYFADRADEEAWELRLQDPRYASKLRGAMAEVEREISAGRSEPLDPERL